MKNIININNINKKIEKSKRKAIGGLVFGIGLIFLLVGAMTQVYSAVIGVLIALGIWIIGGAIVTLMFGSEKKGPTSQV
ncbi:MAG: hypothetical protein WBC21_02720 [Minisyncoccales bacterium]